MKSGIFARYRRPCLLADQVRPVGDSSIELVRGTRTLLLDVAGVREAALADLRALQRGSPSVINGTPVGSPLSVVLEELDALGWVADARRAPLDCGAAVHKALDELVSRGRQVLNGVDTNTRRALERRLLPRSMVSASALPDAARSAKRPPCVQDLLVTALLAQGPRESAWHGLVLSALFGTQEHSWPESKCGWPEDLRELEIAIAALVFWALQAETAPMPLPPLPAVSSYSSVSADKLLRESEARLRDWNAAVPKSPILAARSSMRSAKKIARGIHLQQYYVSLRYVESVLPILVRNSKPTLRALVWEYSQEELGHEDYELEACMRLGLRAKQVRVNAPLPAFATFHRLMAYAAGLHPVAWLTALPLAEGLPGERKPLPAVLARAGLQDAAFGAHVEADVAMDHAWMARRIAAQLGQVDAATQCKAAQVSATAWALTRLGWEQVVARFSSTSGTGIVTSSWDWQDF